MAFSTLPTSFANYWNKAHVLRLNRISSEASDRLRSEVHSVVTIVPLSTIRQEGERAATLPSTNGENA